MDITGTREDKIILFTAYIAIRVVAVLALLTILFGIIGNVYAFLYMIALQVINTALPKQSYDFFKILAIDVINWKYYKLSKLNIDGDNKKFIAHRLFFEYIFKHLILRR